MLKAQAKTPAESRRYTIDWSATLGAATVSTSAWVVQSAQADAVTLTSAAEAAGVTSVRVAGGTAHVDLLLTNTVETSAGDTLVRTLLVPVVAHHFDVTTHATKVLAAIEAVIEGRATVDQQSYTIEGRTLQRTPMQDLLLLRDRYKREVAQEQGELAAAEGRPTRSVIRTKVYW